MYFGSWVALITPFTASGAVDFDSLTRLVEYQLTANTSGLVVLGTTAETSTLTLTEKKEIVDHVTRQVQGRCPIFVGNGSNSTAVAIELTEVLDQYNIDGFLTVVPYYNKPCQLGLEQHFSAVAKATDKAIWLYNVPSRTITDLEPKTIAQLAKIPNITGLKDATADLNRIAYYRQHCPKEFELFSGDDLSALAFARLGGDGVISVTANVTPKLIQNIWEYFADGLIKEAEQQHEELINLHRALFLQPSPAPAKWLLKHLGLITSDTVRLPLIQQGTQIKNQLLAAIEKLEFTV